MKRSGLGLFIAASVLLAPSAAHAFCGFYVSGAEGKLFNDATQVVLMREGTRTVLSMQNDYKGPVRDFAMVVPVPVVLQKENVKTLSRALFEKVDQLSAPRLVEYWEQDPCPKDMPKADLAGMAGAGAMGKGTGLGGLGGGTASTVKIEAEFAVGEYEIVILSAQDSGGLDTWLRTNGYKIPENAEPALKPYVAADSKFFIAKVNASKVTFDKDGRAQLSPLRFHYDTETFQLPVKLGMLNSAGTQDLIVQVLAPNDQRYAVANYPEAVIPTNLDVANSAREGFASFYATLFDKTLEANPNAVVTEYAWGAQSCDPCPGAVQGLTMSDLAALGADVLPSARMGQPGERPFGLGPRGEAKLNPADVTGKITNADRVIAGMRGRMRACYNSGLQQDPSMEGSIKLKAKIDEKGEVTSAEITSNTGLSTAVGTCVTNVVRRAQFEGGPGTVALKVELSSADKPKTPAPAASGAPPKEVLVGIGSGFLLTRLHARYTSGALANDLVFKVADPLMGGREQRRNDGQLERGAFSGGKAMGYRNEFQARYAIRHAWPGPITCENPRRDVWGGPWPDAGAHQGPAAATKLAYAPRGKQLGSFLPKGLPDFRAEVRSVLASDAGATSQGPDASTADAALDADGGTVRAEKGRCGCEVPGANAGASPPLAAVLGLALAGLARAFNKRSRARARRD